MSSLARNPIIGFAQWLSQTRKGAMPALLTSVGYRAHARCPLWSLPTGEVAAAAAAAAAIALAARDAASADAAARPGGAKEDGGAEDAVRTLARRRRRRVPC